jgi:hypothetical protein
MALTAPDCRCFLEIYFQCDAWYSGVPGITGASEMAGGRQADPVVVRSGGPWKRSTGYQAVWRFAEVCHWVWLGEILNEKAFQGALAGKHALVCPTAVRVSLRQRLGGA